MRRWFENYFAGSFVDADGACRPTTVGRPLSSLEEVNLFAIKGGPKVLGQMIGYPFKMGENADRIVVPIVGGFYGSSGVITEQLERQGVVERIKDPSGKPATVPAYGKTARQLYMIASGRMHLLKVDNPNLLGVTDRMIIPNSPEALEHAWDLVMPGRGSQYLREFVDGAIQKAYELRHSAEPYDEFKARYRPSMALKVGADMKILNMVVDGLKTHAVKQGVDASELHLGKIEDAALPVCGIGIKGPGCFNYDGHHVYLGEGGEVILPPNCRLKIKGKDTAFVVDTRFENQKGLMLAIPHQPWSRRPVGAVSITQLFAFERENQLLKHGAELSYITTAVIPLLSREQAPDLCTSQIAIVTNAVIDDSRRIGELLDTDGPLEGRQSAYKAMVVEKFGPICPASEDEVSFVKRNFEAAREKHWNRLCQRVGKNLRAMFDAGFTNPRDQGLIGNISIDGGLCDTVDLAPMRRPKEFHSTLLPALAGLSQFYEVAGFNRADFFRSEHFKTLLRKSLWPEHADQLFERVTAFIQPNDPDVWGVKALRAVGLVADEFIRMAGVDERSVWEMEDMEVLRMLRSNQSLLDSTGVSRHSLRELENSLQLGIQVRKTSGKRVTLADPKEELDYLRGQADITLRCNTAMSMQENSAELEREYRKKFGGG